MTFLRRLTITAGAIAGLAMASPALAQSVPPAPTSAEPGNAEEAIAAFALAFFNDDNDGMLAQLPTLISATLVGGDSGTAAVLEAMGDAIASDDHAAFQSAVDVFERLSTYGTAKRIYDAVLDIAISLGPTIGFTQWTMIGAARTQAADSHWVNAEDGPFAVQVNFMAPAVGMRFTGERLPGSGEFQIEVIAAAMDAYLAGGTVLLIGPDDAITPAPFDLLPNDTRLLLPRSHYDPSWVEALRHADAIVAVVVLGNGDIAQYRLDLDSTGHAILSRAFARWGYPLMGD